jgi:DNA-binding TFAR19-related protein (PDSD5 family)
MSLSDIIAKLKSMEGTEDIVSEIEAEKTDLLGKINQRNEEAKENRLKFESMEATMKSILDKIGTKDAQDAVNKIDGSTAEFAETQERP